VSPATLTMWARVGIVVGLLGAALFFHVFMDKNRVNFVLCKLGRNRSVTASAGRLGTSDPSVGPVASAACERSMCRLLWTQYLNSVKPNPQPPRRSPDEMLQDYSLFGAAVMDFQYSNNVYHGATAQMPVWSAEMVDALVARAQKQKDGDFSVQYGNNPGETAGIHEALRKHPIAGARALVVGSENPWKALLLCYGAAHVTTMEYGKIKSWRRSCQTRRWRDSWRDRLYLTWWFRFRRWNTTDWGDTEIR
jgi:hypothetical protein